MTNFNKGADLRRREVIFQRMGGLPSEFNKSTVTLKDGNSFQRLSNLINSCMMERKDNIELYKNMNDLIKQGKE